MSFAESTDGTRRSTRNPRRRQRPESDSLPSQPRRKRSKISTDTFAAPEAATTAATTAAAAKAATKQNGHAHAGMNGRAARTTRSTRGGSVQPDNAIEVVVRGAKKPAAKRAVKNDGSTVLAQNEHYSVRHLPSTPDILRNSASDYRGSILQSPPLALAVTHERAYIWDYTSPVPVAHPRTFDVTAPTRSSDPLPIGTLVTNSHSRAIGLLIVSSSTGRVTYWENIETAESLGLFQQRSTGVEGSLGSLFGGETVVDIVSAAHAGFVVTLSSGRIAQIGLTDAQGKPKITPTFLRSNEAAGGSGLFGSIKSTFGLGAWKRDVVAVHTRPLGARREVQVIAATQNAQIQVWELAWSGQSVYKGSFEFRDMLLHAIFQLGQSALPLRERSVKVLDMVITPTQPRGDEMVSTTADHDTPLDLMMLVQSDDRPELGPSYTIANVVMFGNRARLERLIPIRSETSQLSGERRPRLFLPKPGHTAYIVTTDQIIFASVAPPEDDSPEAQLMADVQSDTPLFQDSLWLRTGKHLAIEACCDEDLAENRGASACAVFVKGYGLTRVSANGPTTTTRSKPDVKSKIEQAIFYGTMSDNIFDLSRKAKGSDEYPVDQVEEAAVRISSEIVRSTTPYIPTTFTSVETHLASRMKASQALIIYLTNNYPAISRACRRTLMSNAEKLAAAHAVWTMFDEGLATGGRDRPRPSFLPLVIKGAQKKAMSQPGGAGRSSQAQDDPVRQWFISDVDRIGDLRMLSLLLVTRMFDEPKKHDQLMKNISEADDIIFSMYDSVFAFRTDNAELYGFNYANMSEGILEDDYSDLPEPWTSNHDIFNTFNKFIDVARDFTIIYFDKPTDAAKSFIEKVVTENVKLVRILCLLYRERIAYISSHHGDRGAQYPEAFAEAFVAARAHHLRLLGKIGQAGAGIALAEKYHDLETLVRLVMSESEYLAGIVADPALEPHQRALIQARIDDLEGHVQRYFNDVGADWANTYFDLHLERHRSYGLLLEAKKHKGPLTTYLRAEKARGRIGWIHDVLQERDYGEASRALSSLAREQENKLWNKKVELSLGKLASLAVREEKGDRAGVKSQLTQQESDLEIVNIQTAIKASFEPILFAAVDIEAEVQLVSDAYAAGMKRSLPALFNLIEIAFEDMLKHFVLSPERLIDVLTLMADTSDSEISGQQFYLALKVLLAAKKDLSAEKFDVLNRLIWKRCWLAEDWEIVNDNKRKSDKFFQALVREMLVCKTVALCLKNSLFAPGTGLTPLSPTETLGAGSDREDIAYRFHVDDLIDPILHDNTAQDTLLRERIEKSRLEHWHGIAQEEGKKLVEEETEALAAEDKAAAELSQRLAEKEKLGQVTIADGDLIVNGDESEGDEGQGGVQEEDGDVEML